MEATVMGTNANALIAVETHESCVLISIKNGSESERI